jgi:hypothetical protein
VQDDARIEEVVQDDARIEKEGRPSLWEAGHVYLAQRKRRLSGRWIGAISCAILGQGTILHGGYDDIQGMRSDVDLGMP